MNLQTNKFFDFIGRLLLATTFAIAIPSKILKFPLVVKIIANQGIPEPLAVILLIGAIVCLIGGVGFLLFGKDQRIGSLFLLIFIVPTTVVMHFFPFQSMAVFMNLGLIGGLIISLTRFRLPKTSESNNSINRFVDKALELIKKI
tara:strand:- start:499 stop:933 length:435 start_codon:yes stop_codon:yes gene_type:complete